jgi:hypothetical protein
MTATRVQFRVGDFQCIAIKDGTFPYPTDWFFSNVPKAQREDYDLGLSHIVGPYTCLLIRLGNTRYSSTRGQAWFDFWVGKVRSRAARCSSGREPIGLLLAPDSRRRHRFVKLTRIPFVRSTLPNK